VVEEPEDPLVVLDRYDDAEVHRRLRIVKDHLD